MRWILFLFVLFFPNLASAQQTTIDFDNVLNTHIHPRFAKLTAQTKQLADVGSHECNGDENALKETFHLAFDAWISVSHLRFGPGEFEDRAFSLAYWPDTRGFTPKTLNQLLSASDPIINSPDEFKTLSIAGRGFFALEYMLFDAEISRTGDPEYRCLLNKAITSDIALNASSIEQDWLESYGKTFKTPGPENDLYRTDAEVLKELFKALNAGLEFTSDARLGRPLGSFERPRPKRAESWRSGRSLENILLSLSSTRELARLLAIDDPAVKRRLDAAYARSLQLAQGISNPIFADIADRQKRFELEVFRQSIDQIRDVVINELGPSLGVSPGFNALDGD